MARDVVRMGFYYCRRKEGLVMVIMRILNNNAVLTLDEQGQEKIVCGKGIAYKKKIGDFVADSDVNKVFLASDRSERQRLITLLSEIPLEHIKTAGDIVEMANAHFGKKLHDSLYINLSDHIHTSVSRFLDGITVSNTLLWDIRRYYTTEYQVGLKALDIIEENLHVRLPEDEAGFIALHIVNAEMDEANIAQVYRITQVIQELCNLVRYHFTIDFNEESTDYYRFVTHLKFLARRLVEAKQFESHVSDDLYPILAKQYAETYKCVQRICSFVQKKYGYTLSEDEQVYLMIHIERVIYHSKV